MRLNMKVLEGLGPESPHRPQDGAGPVALGVSSLGGGVGELGHGVESRLPLRAGSNTRASGRAFVPSSIQGLEQQQRRVRSKSNLPAPKSRGFTVPGWRRIERALDVSQKVVTSRGGVLVSSVVICLSLGLSPLLVSEPETPATDPAPSSAPVLSANSAPHSALGK